jgi:DNA repair photolyase
MPDPHFHYQDMKKALKKLPLVDSFFISKYSTSPYRACEHACSYCDGRAEKYYVEGDFAQDIIIRRNLPGMLRKELAQQKEKGVVHFCSGVSDPYQPIEKTEMLMRQCAEVILESDFPASVLTKSSLIMRDIELWEQVHKKNGFCLLMTITFLDDKYRQIFEPGASPIEERLATMKAFKDRGIPTGVMAMPLLPHISDSKEFMTNLANTMKELGVDFVVPGELTLRPGRQKEGFMAILKEHFPQLIQSYSDLYSENRPSGRINDQYHQYLYPPFYKIFTEAGIPLLAPHYLYHGLFPKYYELVILLNHMLQLYSWKGMDTRRLKTSNILYLNWLTDKITYMNRSRKRFPQDIEDEIELMMQDGSWALLLKNEKLGDFTKQVFMENKIFDYMDLQFRTELVRIEK